jgi:hypothetical protein
MKNLSLQLSFPCLAIFLVMACVKDGKYETPELNCLSTQEVNASYKDIKDLYQGETLEIVDDLIIEGYVISSDIAGNIYGSLHFQDDPASPAEGLQIDIDLPDSHLFFPPGSHILIRAKGLFLGVSQEVYHLGGVFTAFGNKSVGRLPASAVSLHVFMACEAGPPIRAVNINPGNVSDAMVNTLVHMDGMEFSAESIGQPYALPEEETFHDLQDCEGGKIALLNSGYSDFREEKVPEGNGGITAMLYKEGGDFQLIVRELNDIAFSDNRCADPKGVNLTTKLFISELADPDNHPEARFVELYYTGEVKISLDDWHLRRYTNANTEPGATLDLSGFVLSPNTTFVIAANATAFEAVFGFPPDMEAGANGPADSNGDDTIELLDPSDAIIDIFGIIGEDGSGTNHEFEDGRALRKTSVNSGNPLFSFVEWEIFNDSGQSGTINLPQQAPEDYDPGSHSTDIP